MGKSCDGRELIERYCNEMSIRPEFYSGCGVNRSDLGPVQLEKIYRGLVADFGDEAGTSFCQMIEQLENLSATNFLSQFYLFCARGFVWEPTLSESENDVGPDNEGREALAFVTVVNALSGVSDPEKNRRASIGIKCEFFRAIGYVYQPPVEFRGPLMWRWQG